MYRFGFVIYMTSKCDCAKSPSVVEPLAMALFMSLVHCIRAKKPKYLCGVCVLLIPCQPWNEFRWEASKEHVPTTSHLHLTSNILHQPEFTKQHLTFTTLSRTVRMWHAKLSEITIWIHIVKQMKLLLGCSFKWHSVLLAYCFIRRRQTNIFCLFTSCGQVSPKYFEVVQPKVARLQTKVQSKWNLKSCNRDWKRHHNENCHCALCNPVDWLLPRVEQVADVFQVGRRTVQA